MAFRLLTGVVLVLLWLVAGCATRTYAPTTAAATRELKIQAGDEIRVVTTRRERISFRVTEVRAERFVGVTVEPQRKERRPAGETVEVPFDELAVLQVTRFEAGRAALATAVVAVTVTAAAVVLQAAAVPALPAAPAR